MNTLSKKLKPVTFIKGGYNQYYSQNTFQQMLLLKAMSVSTNPNTWRKMAGLKTMAEVYRTLDKLSMRKAYHEALSINGVDFDFIISGIKNLASSGKNEGVKLEAFKTFLKSLGLDQYEDVGGSSGTTWEDLVMKANDKEKVMIGSGDYDVVVPKIPKSIKTRRQEEIDIGKSLYENK